MSKETQVDPINIEDDVDTLVTFVEKRRTNPEVENN